MKQMLAEMVVVALLNLSPEGWRVQKTPEGVVYVKGKHELRVR